MKALFIYQHFETAKWNRSIMLLTLLFTLCVYSGYGEEIMKTSDESISLADSAANHKESNVDDAYVG